MSTISAISSSTTNSSSATTSTGSTSLDFEDFISLLATELQYQDPTDPVSATEYVTQMTQISSISQLSSIYTAINNTSAYSLIGKDVTYSYTNSEGNTTTGSGTVDSVILSGSNTYLSVSGTRISLDSIVQVEGDSA